MRGKSQRETSPGGLTSQRKPADVLVIGGGVIGAATARELTRYRLRVLLAERGVSPGFGVTKASLSIIHLANICRPGTLKAKLCLESYPLFEQAARELDFRYSKVGELMVALSQEALPVLEKLKAQGEANGLRGFEIVGREQALTLEPELSRKTVGALYSEGQAICYPMELTLALLENACQNGLGLLSEAEVREVSRTDGGPYRVSTSRGPIWARFIVNAGGAWADEVASLMGESVGVTLTKAHLAVLDKEVGNLISHIVYAPPSPGRSQLLTPTVHGNLLIGLGTFTEPHSKRDTAVSREGLQEILAMAQELVPAVSERYVITAFVGLRPDNPRTPEEFLIFPSEKAPGVIHAFICSPGITGVFGIARHVVELLSGEGLELSPREDFNPYRRGIPRFRELPPEEQEALIERDPRFAHMVCRCEGVSEAEVVEAIGRGARTLDGVKHRTRAGMGRCQGGFCSPRVMRILSRELGIPMVDLTKKGANSQHLLFRSKELLKMGTPAEV